MYIITIIYKLFPYTTLFRSLVEEGQSGRKRPTLPFQRFRREHGGEVFGVMRQAMKAGFIVECMCPTFLDVLVRDRKSTRLNSSHVKISYAVFCLKKKKLFLR